MGSKDDSKIDTAIISVPKSYGASPQKAYMGRWGCKTSLGGREGCPLAWPPQNVRQSPLPQGRTVTK